MKKAILVTALAFLVAVMPLAAQKRSELIDVIVVTHDGSHPGSVAAAHAVTPSHVFGTALKGFAASVPAARLAQLQADGNVKYVQLDGEVRALMGPPGGGNGGGPQEIPWGIARIGADTNANEGAGVHVYVIDSGIDSDHPDLPTVASGFAAERCRGRGCNFDWDDDNGHGTHVSGTIAALDNSTGVLGVASQVTLHAAKVLNNSGSGSFSGVTAGIDWAAAEVAARGEAAVANMSLGGGGSKTGTCTDSSFTGSDAMHEALCNAKNVGLITVVAAGNDGGNAANSTPAAYDDAVITVSATSSSDDWPSWSNYGTASASWTSNNSAPVAIAAPGVSVLSTWNDGGTNTISGTSMAAPHVAGAVALYLASTNQSASASAFHNARAALLSGAESTAGFSNSSGNPHDEDYLDAGSL